MIPTDSSAHRSGCHRWHSCPSDNGSYECGDLGHDDYCSNNDDSEEENSDEDNEKEKDEEKEQDSSTIPKSATTEGIELSGPVTYVVDGDTLDVNDVRIRLALVDTPEIGEIGYESAQNFVEDLCLGKDAQVDIDDGQRGGDRYGREIGVVYCNGVNVNSELIDKDLAIIYTEYCDISEFAKDDWAECSSTNSQINTGPVSELNTADTEVDDSNCDPSYPDACIASPPPDLDCADVSQKRFTVSGSDPHGFDRDGDGIGCES
jgi:endonuclease YncB( thermonuclease family)